MLLALSNSSDETADYLLGRLQAKGVAHLRLDSDTLHDHVRVGHDAGGTALHFDSQLFRPHQFSHVWLRRPQKLRVDLGRDDGERDHGRKEWAAAVEGFLAQIPHDRWINHPESNANAGNKIEQLVRARSFGLLTPDTLVTQDVENARKFLQRHANDVIVKPLASGHVMRADGRDGLIYTSIVSPTDLLDGSSLAACPTLFQRRVQKRCDVRVTMLDEHITAVTIARQGPGGEQVLDVRTDNMADAKYIVTVMPHPVRERVAAMVRSYGLRFAAVDFAVDKRGEWYFLEINPNGQWAWLDLFGGTSIWRSFLDVICRPAESAMVPLSVADSALWLALRTCRIPVTRDHVQLKSYENFQYVQHIAPEESGTATKELLDYAIATYGRATERRKWIDEKAKFLAGLVTFGITAATAASSKLQYPAALLFPISCFLCALLLLVAYFRLSVAAQPSISAAEAQQDSTALVRQLISDYLSSADHNERRTSFSAEIFRAAVITFLAGLFTLVVELVFIFSS